MVAPSNNIFLSPASDETSFVSNLQRLLTEPDLRATLGQQNQARCQELFDKSVMYRNYEGIYEIRP